MTTLEKINLSAAIAQTKQVETSLAVQRRQEVAAQGKSVPVTKPTDAMLAEKKKALDKAVANVSNYVQNITRELSFSIDLELDRPIVTVLDQDSGEIIRQIPTEEMLVLAKNISEVQDRMSKNRMKGILFQGDA